MKVEFRWLGGAVTYDLPAKAPLPRQGEVIEFDGSDPDAPAGTYTVMTVVWFMGIRGDDEVRLVLR